MPTTFPPTLGPSPIATIIIADTGSTGHFLSITAPYTHERPAPTPLIISLPDHTTRQSTHTADLTLPHLSTEACTAHIFPALGLMTLISIGQLCDHGCVATFDATTVTTTFHGITVFFGQRSHTTQHLWHLVLPPPPPTPPTALATVNDSATPAELVQFVHAALFSPALSTLT